MVKLGEESGGRYRVERDPLNADRRVRHEGWHGIRMAKHLEVEIAEVDAAAGEVPVRHVGPRDRQTERLGQRAVRPLRVAQGHVDVVYATYCGFRHSGTGQPDSRREAR